MGLIQFPLQRQPESAWQGHLPAVLGLRDGEDEPTGGAGVTSHSEEGSASRQRGAAHLSCSLGHCRAHQSRRQRSQVKGGLLVLGLACRWRHPSPKPSPLMASPLSPLVSSLCAFLQGSELSQVITSKKGSRIPNGRPLRRTVCFLVAFCSTREQPPSHWG